jgi:DNA (cytosine-5)-methyltransferase 1
MKNIELTSKAYNEKIKEQEKLISESIDSGVPFSEILAGKDLCYDDLLYKNYHNIIFSKSKYVPLENLKKPFNNIPTVSFFSGAGGLDLGFEATGFNHVALVEHTALFCSTLKLNRPSWNVLGPPYNSGDISDTENLINALSKTISKNFDGVFIGGPPCQPFSIASNQRFSKSGDNFKRTGFAHETNGNLLFKYIELIKYFKPSAFLIENVPGLQEVDDGKQLQVAYEELESIGYVINKPMVLSASEHNVPQNRKRLFIIGNRFGKDFIAPTPQDILLDCSTVFKLPYKNLHNHITREHSAQSIARYINLNFGERDQKGRVDRLNPMQPSKTVIAGGTKGGGRSHLHPYIPRTISARECARIQTFPDDYIFLGPTARQYTQIGNAVPPVLAAHLASAMYDSFFS